MMTTIFVLILCRRVLGIHLIHMPMMETGSEFGIYKLSTMDRYCIHFIFLDTQLNIYNVYYYMLCNLDLELHHCLYPGMS